MKKLILTLLIAFVPAFTMAGEKENALLRKTVKEYLYGELPRIKSETVVKSSANSITKEILLRHDQLGDISILKRDPIAAKGRKPALFMLTGWGLEYESLSLFPEFERASVVMFKYQLDPKLSQVERVAKLSENFLNVQLKTLMAYLWLTKQPDIMPQRISSINLSFGAYMAPLFLRNLAELEIYPMTTVFLHGGADLKSFMIDDIAKISDQRLRFKVNQNLDALLEYANPARQLKHLVGPFLVINSDADEVLPAASIQALQQGLPEPKEIVGVSGLHIDVDQLAVVQDTLEHTVRWLKSEGAL